MGVIKSTFLTHPAGASYAHPGSNIVFGSGCATVLALCSLALSWFTGQSNPIPLMLGAICLLVVLWSPASFGPLNRAWKTAGTIFSQTAILFFWVLYILPSGLLMQARGRDPLKLRFEPHADTYWNPPHPTHGMRRSS